VLTVDLIPLVLEIFHISVFPLDTLSFCFATTTLSVHTLTNHDPESLPKVGFQDVSCEAPVQEHAQGPVEKVPSTKTNQLAKQNVAKQGHHGSPTLVIDRLERR
jgi:hypothetical protein